MRVDGELQMLDGEPVHVARDVESLLLTLMPERNHEALRTGRGHRMDSAISKAWAACAV